jgi:hypothetical protein
VQLLKYSSQFKKIPNSSQTKHGKGPTMLSKNSLKAVQGFLLVATLGSILSLAIGCSNDKGGVDEGSTTQNAQSQQATTGPTPSASCPAVQVMGEIRPTSQPGMDLTWPVNPCINTRFPGFTKSCHTIYDSNGIKIVFKTEAGAQIGNGLIQSHNVLLGKCKPE